jgi:hypothetical protein
MSLNFVSTDNKLRTDLEAMWDISAITYYRIMTPKAMHSF